MSRSRNVRPGSLGPLAAVVLGLIVGACGEDEPASVGTGAPATGDESDENNNGVGRQPAATTSSSTSHSGTRVSTTMAVVGTTVAIGGPFRWRW